MFITFEGPDGAGKTTQIVLLADRLTSIGVPVVTTREPGGTPLGKELRSLLLDSTHMMTPESEAMLMTADRCEHVTHVVRPALGTGKTVISDRYLDSTLAYQGGGRGLDMSTLYAMQLMATGGLMPDITILLDLPVEVGLKRKSDGVELNRLDRESLDFHERVADTFRRMAAEDSGRWRVVDATQDVHLVHTAIWLHVSAYFEDSRTALVRGEVG